MLRLTMIVCLGLFSACSTRTLDLEASKAPADSGMTDELVDQVAELDERLSYLETYAANTRTDVEECAAELDAVQVRVGDLEAVAGDHSERLAILEEQVAVLWTAAEAMQADLASCGCE